MPTNDDPKELANRARELVTEAAGVVKTMRSSVIASASTKSSPTDPVTEADKAAEKAIVDGINTDRPDDSIIGEEGTDKVGTSGVSWHIDPIDGTTNYLYGYPSFAVSVAAETDGVVVAGAVFDVASGDLYSAHRGSNSVCNDEPIAVTAKNELSSALIATGFSYLSDRRREQAQVLVDLLPQVRDIRRAGSAAVDLCLLASGRVDAYFESGLNFWDFAAGWIIVEQAGGTCTGLHTPHPDSAFLVAGGPGVHGLLQSALVDADA